jgi:hypothetical protein
MSSVASSVISSDLDYLINEQRTELTGVTPSSVAGIVYEGSMQSLEDGYEVELAGKEVTIDTEYVLNEGKHSTNPSKGAVLEDSEGVKYKVALVKKERLGILMKLYLTSQYQRSR